MNVLGSKLKEVLFAVLPIVILVLILNFTLTPLTGGLFVRFIIGTATIIFGLSIFLFGVDLGITPIGQSIGAALAKSNKVWIVMIVGLLLGFFISIAEPDLHILSGQVNMVTSGLISKASLVVVVSIGIGVLIAVGLVRIVYNFPLYKLLSIIYFIILILAIFTSPEFLAISFDASGATTGALTVPFILALALGISALKKDSLASEKDSFGLVAIASSGAIIAVMIMNIVMQTDKMSGNLEAAGESNAIIMPFLSELPVITFEIIVALLPMLIIFFIFQKVALKMKKRAIRRILIGLLFTFIGLILFLLGVNAAFMEVGSVIGYELASLDNDVFILVVSFALGLVTILAEPAVHVLTSQVENVTTGYVRKPIVLGTLAIGVGLAVLLSTIRVLVPGLELWHYLLPGYVIAIILTYFAPKLFVGIAFDSGGVASGPMTATFILAFVQGAAEAVSGADVLVDGFGMIAMVAMTPLIVLQILGLVFKLKSRKARGSKVNVKQR